MFLGIQIHPDSDKCANCLTLGRTITQDDLVKAEAHGLKKLPIIRSTPVKGFPEQKKEEWIGEYPEDLPEPDVVVG